MDIIILDFEGQQIHIPSGFTYERNVSQIGMKIEHSGKMWEVVDRKIVGLDDLVNEIAVRGMSPEPPLASPLTLVISLKKI